MAANNLPASNPVEDAVDRLYQRELLRHADQIGIPIFSQLLAFSGKDGPQLVCAELAYSKEFSDSVNKENTPAELYRRILGRSPSLGEQRKTSQAIKRDGFQDTAESIIREHFGELSNQLPKPSLSACRQYVDSMSKDQRKSALTQTCHAYTILKKMIPPGILSQAGASELAFLKLLQKQPQISPAENLILLNRIAQIEPQSWSTKLAHAQTLWQCGRKDEALQQAAVIPNTALAHAERASAYLHMGLNELALKDCEECIRLDPNEPEAYMHRAQIMSAKGEHKRALADLDKFDQLKPNNNESVTLRPGELMSLREFDKALPVVNKALKLQPNNPQLYVFRAFINYWSLNNKKQGWQDVNKSLKIDPKWYPALQAKASMLCDEDRLQEALSVSNKAIDINPNLSDGYDLRAQIYEKMGNEKKEFADRKKAFALRKMAGRPARK